MANSVFVTGPCVLSGLPPEIEVGDWQVEFPHYEQFICGVEATLKIRARYIRLFNVTIRRGNQTFRFPEMLIKGCNLEAVLIPTTVFDTEKQEDVTKFWDVDTPTIVDRK